MNKTLSTLFALTFLSVGATAFAQDDSGVDVGLTMDSLPELTFDVERFPPNFSYEFGMHFSLGTVTYWNEFIEGGIGFGARFSGGKHLGNHRIGGMFTAVMEGPFGVYTSFAAEPHVAWDHVSDKNLQVGLSAGPAFMYHVRADITEVERFGTVNPSAAVRLGWSQTWTKVGRRLYVVAEPKFRYIRGQPDVLGALVVGSGGGN